MIFLLIGFVAGIIGAVIAGNKNRNGLLWFVLCFLLPIFVIVLLFLPDEASNKTQIAGGGVLDDRWNNISKYDPDIKVALDKLKPYGNAAELAFKRAYSDVQNKDAIDAIVSDIIAIAKKGDEKSIIALSHDGKVYDTYKGYDIYQLPNEDFLVSGKTFKSYHGARSYINYLAKIDKKRA